jgi:hypothetical protein
MQKLLNQNLDFTLNKPTETHINSIADLHLLQKEDLTLDNITLNELDEERVIEVPQRIPVKLLTKTEFKKSADPFLTLPSLMRTFCILILTSKREIIEGFGNIKTIHPEAIFPRMFSYKGEAHSSIIPELKQINGDPLIYSLNIKLAWNLTPRQRQIILRRIFYSKQVIEEFHFKASVSAKEASYDTLDQLIVDSSGSKFRKNTIFNLSFSLV